LLSYCSYLPTILTVSRPDFSVSPINQKLFNIVGRNDEGFSPFIIISKGLGETNLFR
jgi:hypothetical protein